MTLLHRVIVAEDKEESSVNGMKLFSFHFNEEGGSLFGVSQDLNKLYKYIQIGETGSKKNSWFFGDQVISDGRMFGLVPILKGWIFLSLFSKCPRAKSLFLTIDDMLYEEGSESSDPIIQQIFTSNRDEIEAFLSKLMPSQMNIENYLGFRYDEVKVIDSLHQTINEKAKGIEIESASAIDYFNTKWSCATGAAFVLDNLQLHLPKEIFIGLCDRFKLHPISSEDLNKRLKINESLLLKPIKYQTGRDADCTLAPTSDYTKFDSKLKPEKTKNPKFAVTGNTSMLNFFKKTQ